jgi:hypothetical protein
MEHAEDLIKTKKNLKKVPMCLRAQVDSRNAGKFEFTGQQDHKHVTVTI